MTSISAITFKFDPESSTPLYEQLYKHVKIKITNGNYPCDAKLPSKRRLSAHIQCSLNTVQNAYGQLAAEGYITARQRSGYYVSRLDGIININISSGSAASRDDAASETEYRYDFSHHGIDQEGFPFAIWRRITREVLNEYDTELLKPSDPSGDIKLRAAISDYLLHSRGVNCASRQVIISSGTEFLIQMLIQLFGRESVYALEEPGYEKLNMVFRSNRASYTTILLDEDGMRPDLLVESGAGVACVTPSHQFPTGSIMPVSRRIQLLNWANEKTERFIIEDDYDSEFKYFGKPIPSLQGLDTGEKTIYMGSFSKSLTPSLRISYMVLPELLLKAYNDRLNFYICPVPLIEQKVLYRFISGGYFERHLNRMRNIYRKKREVLVSAIRKLLPRGEIAGANAGLHIVLRMKNGMDEEALVKAAERKGVRVYGLSKFYAGDARLRGCDRSSLLLGFASLKTDEIYKAVSLLQEVY